MKTSGILKKILKYTLRVILILIGFLLLLSVLVYLPPVQNLIKNTASSYVTKNMGMELNMGRFRLHFPLTVVIDDVSVVKPAGDTLAGFEKLYVRVSLLPLLRKEVRAGRIDLTKAVINYDDSLSGISIGARIGELGIKAAGIKLSDNDVSIGDIGLYECDARLFLGESNAVDTSSAGPLLWKIAVDNFKMGNIRFAMETAPEVTRLNVDLGGGLLSGLAVDLGTQDVVAGMLRLESGSYSYLTDTVSVEGNVAEMPDSSAIEAESLPWTVRLEKLGIIDNAVAYGSLYGEPAEGFDPSHIRLSDVNIDIDSIYNRGSDVSAVIRDMTLAERSGLEVTAASGRFSMDTLQLKLSGFDLNTRYSSLHADAIAGTGVMEMLTDAPLSANLAASVGPGDIYLFYPAEENFRQALQGKVLSVNADLSGTLGEINIKELQAGLPGHIIFNAEGSLRSVTDPDNLAANINFNGRFEDLEFAKAFLPDSLRGRIGFPEKMSLDGDFSMGNDLYVADMRLTADTSRLDLKARANLKAESYSAALSTEDFPVYRFLPKDSLGFLSLALDAEGRGFDFMADSTKADINVAIDRFDYNNYDYGGVSLVADMYDHNVNGKLLSLSEAANFDIDVKGTVYKDDYSADINGVIAELDLQRLGFSQSRLGGSMVIDISAAAKPDSSLYKADVVLDSVRFAHGAKTEDIGTTSLQALAGRSEIDVKLRSGDLSLDFLSPMPVDSLLASFTAVADSVMNQMAASDINMTGINNALPRFSLKASAGQDNIARRLLKETGTDFQNLVLDASVGDGNPLDVRGTVKSLAVGEIVLDTINMRLRSQDEALNARLRVKNKKGTMGKMAVVGMNADILHNTARLSVSQRDWADSTGFDFGLNAQLLDSAVNVSVFPEDPVFGYKKWTVNDGNYLTYRFNNEIFADMRLQGQEQHVYILSADNADMNNGAVRLDMEGIILSEIFDLLSIPLPLDGVLSTDMAFGMGGGIMALNGNAGVDSFYYNKQKVGDLGAEVVFKSDTTGMWEMNGGVSLDKASVLTAEGTYEPRGGNIDFKAEIPSLPMSAANPFIPDATVILSGAMQGGVTVNGTMSAMNINGELGFSGGRVEVPMIGTAYKLSERKILVSDSRVDFNEFSLISPDNKELSIDGTVDIRDFDRMAADLSLFAADFDVINSSRNGGSQVYGKASIDVDITAKGAVDAISVRGDVGLLSNTDVVYTMMDSPLEVEDKQQNIVTFVSFDDPASMAVNDSVPELRLWSVDMLVNVNIDDNVKATVNLSDNGNNRIELIGGGALTYSMNNQGDTRFAGRYALTGGTVVYNPPVIPQKNFSITDGSYVEWTGEMLDPSFNITAVQTVRTTVSMEGGSTSTVNFDIIVNIKNSLKDMALTFDLEAPDNLTIQNQLTSLAPEQRSTQAMALMVYNTYTGPGTTAKVDTNNPLNSFIEKELNQWARNNLKNVDVSFGIDSYDDAGGGSQHTDYSYKVSKSLFDDRIKVTVGGSISTEANTTENLKDNFVDDISLEYRLTKRDNMFLKAYRYNTQESILEGEVVETGGGFLVRKKLNKLKDLFRFTRSPEKKQAAQQRREMRQMRKEDELEALNSDNQEQQEQDIIEEPQVPEQ